MSPQEELDDYIAGSEDRDPLLTFLPLGLPDMFGQEIIASPDNKKFEIIIHNDPGGHRPIDIFEKVVGFTYEVLINAKRVSVCGSSFCKEDGKENIGKIDKFNEDLVLFLQKGVMSKFLYDAFPDNGLRRSFLGRIILGAPREISIDWYENSQEEAEKRKREEEAFGSLVEMDPLVVMRMVGDFCSEIPLRYKQIIRKEGKNTANGSGRVSIAITKKEFTLIKYFAHKFEQFSRLDGVGKHRSFKPGGKYRSKKPRGRRGREIMDLEQNEIKNMLESNKEALSPRERIILELRFGLQGREPRTLEEVGEKFNLTKQRIKQIEAKALEKLEDAST